MTIANELRAQQLMRLQLTHHSHLPQISHPVASDGPRSRTSEVLPTAAENESKRLRGGSSGATGKARGTAGDLYRL